jgi:hypothetical protein
MFLDSLLRLLKRCWLSVDKILGDTWYAPLCKAKHSGVLAVEVCLSVDLLKRGLVVGASDDKRDAHLVFVSRCHLNHWLHVEDVGVSTRIH